MSLLCTQHLLNVEKCITSFVSRQFRVTLQSKSFGDIFQFYCQGMLNI